MATWLEIRSDSPHRTESIAETLGGLLRGGDLVTLDGDLGAGKTCFVRGLAQGLGIDAHEVSSPSFVLVQHYGPGERAPGGEPIELVHMDAYRVESPDALRGIGLDELLADPTRIVAVEWPSRMAALLPSGRVEVRLRPAESEGPASAEARRILIRDRRGDSREARRLREALAELHGAADAPSEDGERCPICRTLLGETAADAPFCSPRCRMADLGRWMRGEYLLSRELAEEEEA
jgi:tRNA threonylcarbamoyladenosine biosynthesis protein TsaE